MYEQELRKYWPWDLYEFREASERFPTNTRKLNVTYNGHSRVTISKSWSALLHNSSLAMCLGWSMRTLKRTLNMDLGERARD